MKCIKYLYLILFLIILSVSLISVVSAGDTSYSCSPYESGFAQISDESFNDVNGEEIQSNVPTTKLYANNSKQLEKKLSRIHDDGNYQIFYSNDSFSNATINIGDKNKTFKPNISIVGDIFYLNNYNASSNFKINIYSGCLNLKYITFAEDNSTEYTITNYANLSFENVNFLRNNNFIKNYANITINNSKILANNASDAFISNDNGSVIIDNSDIRLNMIHLAENNANLTIVNNRINEQSYITQTGTGLNDDFFLKNSNGANLNIEKNNFYHFVGNKTSIIKNYGNLTVYDNIFNKNMVNHIIENYAAARITFNDFEENLVNSLIYNDFDKNNSFKDYIYIKSNNFQFNSGLNGAILVNKAKAIFNTNNASKNTGLSNAGCIFNKGKLITHYNKFQYNNASSGGVIFNSKILTSSKDYYNHNTAVIGGCIYNTGNSTITNVMIKFSNAINGSAVYTKGNMSISKSNINKNKANDSGTIFNNGMLTLTYNSLYYNKATSYGGVIMNYYTVISLRNAYKHNIAGIGSAVASNCSEHIIKNNNMLQQNTGSNTLINPSYLPEEYVIFGSSYSSLNDVYTLNKANIEATILNNGHAVLSDCTMKTLGVNNYIIINNGTLTLKRCELINYNHLNETLIKNTGKLYNSTC